MTQHGRCRVGTGYATANVWYAVVRKNETQITLTGLEEGGSCDVTQQVPGRKRFWYILDFRECFWLAAVWQGTV